MTLLMVYQDDDFDKSLRVHLDDETGKVLFQALTPLFTKLMANEAFGLEHYQKMYQEHNFIEFDDLSADDFMQTYRFLQKSNDKDLQPFVAEILTTMRYDKRYTA